MPLLRFKRELQTANVTARPWSRDILRFAVCGLRFAVCGLRFAVSHEKPDAKGPYCRFITGR